MMTEYTAANSSQTSIFQLSTWLGKHVRAQWTFSRGFIFGVALLTLILTLSVFALYTAGQGWFPWAIAHLWRIAFGLCVLIVIVIAPIRILLKYAYALYGFNLLLLLLIPLFGITNMGAQRWLVIGDLSLQPSEPMKVFLILALARYFHGFKKDEGVRLKSLIAPVLMIAAPTFLVLQQPDLGTGLMILVGGGMVIFFAGVRWRILAAAAGLLTLAIPLIWNFGIHDYQRQRVLSFLNPNSDLLDSGYQLMQSKIAIGAGGLHGQGLMQGTQSTLGFIPAKHTDFIFSLLAEQFGFIGSVFILMVILLLIVYCVYTALIVRNRFGQNLILGLAGLWLVQSLINLAMVMGLLPVVGIPLPFLSYGGTSLLSCMTGFGLILNMHLNQFARLRYGH